MKSAAICSVQKPSRHTLPLCDLLLLATASCGSEGGGAGTNGPATPRTSVPAALAAEWYAGNVSSVNFFDASSGSWGAPSGPGIFFHFSPDGDYEKGVLLQSSLYGCTMTYEAYSRGTMTVSGDRIGLYPTYGKEKSVDSCVAANNYEKSYDAPAEDLQWQLDATQTLWLGYVGGTPSAFHQ
jgi:hypothetical protein